jgi:hypothetical protein
VIQVKNRVETTRPGFILKEEFTMVEDRKQRASESSSTKAKKGETSKIASTKAKKEEEKDPIRNDEMENPILFLLFDFGGARTDKSVAESVEVLYSSDIKNGQRVWAIHSRGHDEKVFGCLSHMECVNAANMFFISAVPSDSMHDQAARKNDVFCKLHRSFRYSSAVTGTGKSETENEEEGGREGGSKRLRR